MELGGDECDNLNFMNFLKLSFKIHKNLWILRTFKICTIQILNLWRDQSTSRLDRRSDEGRWQQMASPEANGSADFWQFIQNHAAAAYAI